MTTKIRLTKPQLAFVAAREQFPCMVAGFGAGKTEAAIVRALVSKLRYAKQNVAYYLPTYDLVRNIGYPRVMEKLDELKISGVLNRTEATIQVPGAGQVIFRTMDTPERIVGYEVADSIVDELDTLPTEKARHVWSKIIARNRQKKPDGSLNTVGVATTPEGFRFVYDRWHRHPAAGYRLIKATTQSNARNLPDGYIDSLRASYPPNLLSAYLEGEFVNLTSGSVYPDFDRAAAHTSETIRPSEVLHVGMDFNVMNMTAVISVIRDDLPLTLAEITGVRDTPAMAASLRARYPNHAIVVYPDASGASRKSVNAQESDLSILREAGFTLRVDPANPAVRDRINAVNAIIPRWRINTDACPVLTESLEQQAYDKNGEPSKEGGHDHAVDAIGYFISQRWPITKRRATVTTLRI